MIKFKRQSRGRDAGAAVWSKWVVHVAVALCAALLAAPPARAETRSLKFYHLHTHEKAEIVFKRNGRYDRSGLKKINYILRDWRRNEPVNMDPRLLDLVWEAYRASGSRDYIQVICGYRSPSTNSMLRSRSKGVAKKSQHMLGKALDFYIPGVPLKKLRDIGLKMQGGGVGYYPSSGSPFVHMDVGNVRHWPGISRSELARVFPNGKTLHVPSDGKPLPGYEQALAAYKARKRDGEPAIALASASGGGSRSGGLLSALFGGGADDEEDRSEAAVVASAKAAPRSDTKTSAKIRVVPPELAEPAETPQETIVAALPTREIPLPEIAPRPTRDVGAPLVDLDAPAAPLIDLGKASEQPVAAAAVALNIPMPSWRPAYALDASDDEASEPDSFVVASAGPTTVSEALAAEAPLPSLRPSAAQTAFAVAALPDVVSAVPEAPLAYAAPETAKGFAPAPDQMIATPKGARVAAPVRSASLKSVLSERAPGSDAASVIRSGVRTTEKTDRASREDTKPDPKPVVVAAQPQAARWALDADYVKNNTKGTRAPSFAYRIVRSAPREIYATGFQQEDQQLAYANRFSGSAVTFLRVARFN